MHRVTEVRRIKLSECVNIPVGYVCGRLRLFICVNLRNLDNVCTILEFKLLMARVIKFPNGLKLSTFSG